MTTVAYLANQFPSAVEPYVLEEIEELRRRGIEVIACSVRRSSDAEGEPRLRSWASEAVCLQPLRLWLLVRAVGLCLAKLPDLADLGRRVMWEGSEPLGRRLRAVLHTVLGAGVALRLQNCNVKHIHVHHGYAASWIAMVAARLLRIPFSMTLHGSDLLLHGAYLDVKLQHCKFCVTISEFNRCFALQRYSAIDTGKITVQRIGVRVPDLTAVQANVREGAGRLMMLAVGRLHPVKDHEFLLRACYELQRQGLDFACAIAGEGPEHARLEHLIRNLGLEGTVRLLGHLTRQQLDACYLACDLVVLTSRSEGIPLVLMEAMAHGRIVLAPAITGIPELVKDGQTGFLYCPGSMPDFVAKVRIIRDSRPGLSRLRRAARQHVLQHFDREKNLAALADFLVTRLQEGNGTLNENPLLQQV